MSPQRRTALLSVVAATALIALKLATGLATHSLGLISEAVHSGTDLVAALLTFLDFPLPPGSAKPVAAKASSPKTSVARTNRRFIRTPLS